MKDIYKGVKIAAVFASTILGAGFASGKEIVTFFTSYGIWGYYGLLTAGAVFGLAGAAVLGICRRERIDSYARFMDKVAGSFFGMVMEAVLGLFLFVIFSAMLSAMDAAFSQSFNLPTYAGIIIGAVLCLLLFLRGMESIILLNARLSPVMILGCVFIGLYTYSKAPAKPPSQASLSFNWLGAGIIYSSYNIVTSITVLCAMSRDIKTKKTAWIGGILGGIIISITGLCLALGLNAHSEAWTADIPLLSITSRHNYLLIILYPVIFLTAVFTSAATAGYALIQWLSHRFTIRNRLPLSITTTLLAAMGATMGFSNFINVVYPVFGIVGFFEILIIIQYFFTQRRVRLYNEYKP